VLRKYAPHSRSLAAAMPGGLPASQVGMESSFPNLTRIDKPRRVMANIQCLRVASPSESR